MKYQLQKYGDGANQPLELTAMEFRDIVAAKDRSAISLSLEESLDTVLRNFEEFELDLVSMSLKYSPYLRAEPTWSELMDLIQLLSRRAASVLNSCFAYRDYAKKRLRRFFDKGTPELGQALALFDVKQSAPKAIRVGEAIRAHIQHVDTVIHSISLKHSWRSSEGTQAYLEAAVIPYLNVALLSGGRDSEQVKADLAGAPDDRRDLRPLIREYVASTAQLQDQLRQLMHERLRADDTVLHAIVNRFNTEYGLHGDGHFVLYELNDAELLEGREPLPLMLTHIERRNMLRARNAHAAHVDKLRVAATP